MPPLTAPNMSLQREYLEWTLRSCFNPALRSHNGRIRCLCAEIVTDHQDSLIVISNIKHYNTYPPSNTHVNFVLGSTEIKTGALAASQGDGIAYLWGSLPKSHIRDKLEISLQVSIDSIVCDSLFIGVLHVREPPIRPTLSRTDSFSFNDSVESEGSLPISPSPEKARNLSGCDGKDDPSRPLVIEDGYDLLLPDHQRIELRTRDFGCILDSWTLAEIAAGRRLVRFDRRQEAHVVHLEFTPHLPEEAYDKSSQVVISCIKWPETDSDFFITSFDVLRLAEFILKLPMNTEMKNRVRRNMAIVDYVTLPKGKKPSSSHPDPKKDPFTLIMSFETYLPRSIEKSIKVYDWDNLKDCLARILQRFVVADPDASPGDVKFEHQLEAAKRLKRRKRRSALPATIDPPEAHHQRHGAGIVERPAIAPANTPQRPSLGRHIRHKPYPKRKQEVTAPRGVGPDRTRRGNHSSKLPNGSVALGSNVSSEVWGPSIGRKSSTIASAAEYLEDSSQSQSILSDYSDHTAFDPLPIPREHRGHTIRSSLPPPPTLSHRSSFEDINLGPSITTGGHGFMNPLQHPSLEFLNTPSKDPPPEMYSGDWTQHTPSHPLTPVTPVSSHGIPDYVYVVPTQIHEPVPMRQMMPQYFPSVHVASPGYHDMITNGPGSSYITDYYFPTQLHGAPRPNHSWNGQGPVNTIHPPQTYIAVEEDSEIARNVEEWLNTEYIMSQE